MNQTHKFCAVIEDAGGGGAFVRVPIDVEQAFGKKRVKVKAWIEGVEYRGSLVRMGGPDHILGVPRDIREKIGKTIGDEIEVVVAEDSEPRVVTVPPDLRQALESDPGTAVVFARLSFSHQKEYVQWIEEARRPETRQKRICQAVRMIKQGKCES